MKLFSSKKRVAAIGAVTAVTLAGGGVAMAYWTASGSGTGTATTATSDANVTVTQAALNPMYPGDDAQTLDLTLTNDSPSGQSAFITSLTASITTTAGANCDASNFLINGVAASNPTTLIWNGTDIPVGSPASSTDNTIQFNNKDANQNLCQGADVTIQYSAS
jgi:hypothetical protein